ncbi:hypothetical protein CCP4SC76_8240001 [Gammaproteobacteria bacterium]
MATRLDAALAANFVMRREGDLLLAAELAQGQLTLNGQVVPLTARFSMKP